MRLLIDLQSIQNDSSRFRGIGRYSLALIKSIIKNSKEHQIYILLNGTFKETLSEIVAELSGFISPSRILVFNSLEYIAERYQTNQWRTRAAELIREQVINQFSPDAILICSLFEGVGDNTVVSIGTLPTQVVTATMVYDLIPLLYPEYYLKGYWREWYYRKIHFLKKADLFLTISQSSALEVINELHIDPAKIVNISSGVAQKFCAKTLSKEKIDYCLRRYGLNKKFVMHASASDPRKNFEGLLKAFAGLPLTVRNDFQLLFVMNVEPSSVEAKFLHALAKEHGLQQGQLILTGFVDDEELIALYSSCYLFVFPSFYEGFGLPVVEAMSCGAATIGSNKTSIPEVIDRSDALFDPYSIKDMQLVLERALIDQEFWLSLKLHAKFQAQKFSWDKTAKLAIESIENAVTNKKDAAKISSVQTFGHYLSMIDSEVKPTDKDFVNVAQCLYLNEILLNTVKATSDYIGKKLFISQLRARTFRSGLS